MITKYEKEFAKQIQHRNKKDQSSMLEVERGEERHLLFSAGNLKTNVLANELSCRIKKSNSNLAKRLPENKPILLTGAERIQKFPESKKRTPSEDRARKNKEATRKRQQRLKKAKI